MPNYGGPKDTQKKTFNKRRNIYYSILCSFMDKYYELQNLKIIVESPKMAAFFKMISAYLTLLIDAVLVVVALPRFKLEENREETSINTEKIIQKQIQ